MLVVTGQSTGGMCGAAAAQEPAWVQALQTAHTPVLHAHGSKGTDRLASQACEAKRELDIRHAVMWVSNLVLCTSWDGTGVSP